MILKKIEIVNRLIGILKNYCNKNYLLGFDMLNNGWRVYIIKYPPEEIVKKVKNFRDVESRKVLEPYILLYLDLFNDGSIKFVSKMGFKERTLIQEDKVFIGRPHEFINYIFTEAEKLSKTKQ